MVDDWQTVALPEIVPGWLGVGLTVTGKVEVLEVPHPLVAATVILPLEPPAVAEMLLVVLLPVHEPGKVQI